MCRGGTRHRRAARLGEADRAGLPDRRGRSCGNRRRRGQAPAGAAQPAVERGQVHRGGRGRRRGRRRADRSELLSSRARGARHRDRDPAGSDGRAVRIVQPGRRLHDPPLRRHRARARDLEATRRADGRHDGGRERDEQGLDLPHRARRRCGRGSGAPGRPRRPAAARRQADPRGRRQRDEPRDRCSARALVEHGARPGRERSRSARPHRARREVRPRGARHDDAGDGRARPRRRDPTVSRSPRASARAADIARPPSGSDSRPGRSRCSSRSR